jgi:hypothetical protein
MQTQDYTWAQAVSGWLDHAGQSIPDKLMKNRAALRNRSASTSKISLIALATDTYYTFALID